MWLSTRGGIGRVGPDPTPGGIDLSKRMLYVLAVLLAVPCAGGCAIPTSIDGYVENRRQDLIDVVHVDLSAANVGTVAYAGPFVVGLNYITGLGGRDAPSSLQIGLGGPRMLARRGLAAGLLVPASHWNGDKPVTGGRPKRSPSGTSVGASAGLLAGVGAEADILELFDFAFGVVCIDIAGDDRDTAKPSMKPVEDLLARATGILVDRAIGRIPP